MAYINGKEILFTPIVNVTKEQELIPITVEGLLAEVELPSTSTNGKYNLSPIDAAALGFETPLTKLGVKFTPYREENDLVSSNGLVDIKTKAYGVITMWYIGNLSLYDGSAEDTGENYLLLGVGNDDILGSTDMAFYCTSEDGTIYTRDGTLLLYAGKTVYLGEIDAIVMGTMENLVSDALYVGDYVFSDQSSLTRADLPKATSIGDSAFILAENLKTVNLPNVTSIKRNAFAGCYSLTTANIPNLTSAEDYAFRNCSSLTEVNFPKLTSTLRTFYGCTSLTKVNFPNLTRVGESDFQGCTSLNEVNLPNTITIGSGAFSNCTNLTALRFPNVEEILSLAFNGCTNLEKLDLLCSTGVYIASRAFKNCTNLRALILRSTEYLHTLVNEDALTGTAIESGTGYIYVPSALVDIYKTTANWSTYANQFRAIEDYPDVCG